MSIVTEMALICTILGGVIGYVVGYRHGHNDTEKVYKDVYDIKDWS
jgi:membrane protein YqaA with SNARE-associated domain